MPKHSFHFGIFHKLCFDQTTFGHQTILKETADDLATHESFVYPIAQMVYVFLKLAEHLPDFTQSAQPACRIIGNRNLCQNAVDEYLLVLGTPPFADMVIHGSDKLCPTPIIKFHTRSRVRPTNHRMNHLTTIREVVQPLMDIDSMEHINSALHLAFKVFQSCAVCQVNMDSVRMSQEFIIKFPLDFCPSKRALVNQVPNFPPVAIVQRLPPSSQIVLSDILGMPGWRFFKPAEAIMIRLLVIITRPDINNRILGLADRSSLFLGQARRPDRVKTFLVLPTLILDIDTLFIS